MKLFFSLAVLVILAGLFGGPAEGRHRRMSRIRSGQVIVQAPVPVSTAQSGRRPSSRGSPQPQPVSVQPQQPVFVPAAPPGPGSPPPAARSPRPVSDPRGGRRRPGSSRAQSRFVSAAPATQPTLSPVQAPAAQVPVVVKFGGGSSRGRGGSRGPGSRGPGSRGP